MPSKTKGNSQPKQPLSPTTAPRILVEKREKLPYEFTGCSPDKSLRIPEALQRPEKTHLKTGDYSLSGFTGKIVIERKSLADLYATLSKQSKRDRFQRELRRMRTIDHCYVVVESSLTEIIDNPPPRTKLLPKAVYRTIIAYQRRFPWVHWWFCDSRELAERTTYRILEGFWREQLESIRAASLCDTSVCSEVYSEDAKQIESQENIIFSEDNNTEWK